MKKIEKTISKHPFVLTLVPLMASYLIFLFLHQKNLPHLYLFLGLLPAAGFWTAWLVIKKWKLDETHFFKKYDLYPAMAALGLGGPLAGLPALFTFRNYTEDILVTIVFLISIGQIFWLLWPVAALRALCHHRPRLVELGDVIQIIIAVLGVLGLLPFFNVALSFVFMILLAQALSLFGYL